QGRGRYPDVVGIEPRSRIVDTLIGEEEEALVLAAVHLRNGYWTTNAKAGTIREAVRSTLPLGIAKEVVGSPTSGLEPVVNRAMKVVRAAFGNDAGDATFGVAELSVVRRGLYSEFLCRIAGRNVRSDYFVGICCRRAGGAIDQEIAADAARAAHREVRDVGWFKRSIQTRAAGIGNTRRQIDKHVRIA